ncbi:MAG: rhamnogalacturonan acetylesterase [Ginsengibacter sp.]
MNKHIKKTRRWTLAMLLVITLLSSFIIFKDRRATLYIIGDSTVKNGQGKGGGGLWGWGDFVSQYFDTTRIKIENDALGGTSSRTFQTKGLWDSVLKKIETGDFVMMQFGHNDGSPLADTARARGTIPGIGDESKEIDNPITKQIEVVHSYGWYMRKYISNVVAKGAIPIVCSPIPRNEWKDGKVIRSSEGYGLWARQVAKSENVYFIDLNSLIAAKYEELGTDKVKAFFPGDNTHTSLEGAQLNAEIVAKALKEKGPTQIRKYIK